MKTTHVFLPLSLAGFAVSAPLSAASASMNAEEQAVALFEQAQAEAAEGQYEIACPRFERSLALRRGVGTMFNLADCYEQQGKLASAHELFSAVAVETRKAGQFERAALAHQRAQALLPKLSYLLIEQSAPEAGLEIAFDEQTLASEQLETPFAVDTGTHLVRATAPGKRPWEVRVAVPTGGAHVLVIPTLQNAEEVPAVEASALGAPETEPPDEAAPEPEPEAEPANEYETHLDGLTLRVDTDTGVEREVLTYGMTGLGVVGVAGALVLALEFQSDNDEARAICPSSVGCTNEEIRRHNELVESAREARTWGFVSGGVGGALLIGAAVLWATQDDERAWAPSPMLTADGGYGAGVVGRF